MKGPAEIAHGPMFVGFTFNVLLYGVMIAQAYMYFTTYKQDKTWMKCFVFLLLFCDTANTVFDFVYLYKSLVLHFDDPAYLSNADWLFATDPAITGITASLVQIFFAWRVRILTDSWLLGALVLFGSLSGGGAIVTSVEVGRTPQFIHFRDFKGAVIMWLASESVTDIIITSLLVWYLWDFFSQRSHKTGFSNSDYILDRLIRMTVQTGMVTSLVATLDLVFFLSEPTGTHLIFNFPLCKLYTNSLMSSLNSRTGWKYQSTIPRLSTFHSERHPGTLSGAPYSHYTPPSSPTGPGYGTPFGSNYRDSFNSFIGESDRPRSNRRRSSLSMGGSIPPLPKPLTAMQKNGPSEEFVQVGPPQMHDDHAFGIKDISRVTKRGSHRHHLSIETIMSAGGSSK